MDAETYYDMDKLPEALRLRAYYPGDAPDDTGNSLPRGIYNVWSFQLDTQTSGVVTLISSEMMGNQVVAVPLYYKHVEFNNVVILRPTGLIDKDNTPLYEHDLVQDEETREIGEIKYELGGFYCTYDCGGDLAKWLCRYAKKVGNRHTHPQLLKGDSNE